MYSLASLHLLDDVPAKFIVVLGVLLLLLFLGAFHWRALLFQRLLKQSNFVVHAELVLAPDSLHHDVRIYDLLQLYRPLRLLESISIVDPLALKLVHAVQVELVRVELSVVNTVLFDGLLG